MNIKYVTEHHVLYMQDKLDLLLYYILYYIIFHLVKNVIANNCDIYILNILIIGEKCDYKSTLQIDFMGKKVTKFFKTVPAHLNLMKRQRGLKRKIKSFKNAESTFQREHLSPLMPTDPWRNHSGQRDSVLD